MKKILLFICLIILLVSSGCTRPEGDIGDWFGSWHLEEMLIDGELDEQYAQYQEHDIRQVMISFHGDIFNIAYINGGFEQYGSWSYAGEILTLIVEHYDLIENNPWFNPYPSVLHFPADVEQVEITVTQIGSKTMQWQLIDQNGRLITYNFRKYP